MLGLVVDLAPVLLDILAVPGPGNLLGNLLCAIVSLLDFPALLGVGSQLLDVVIRSLEGWPGPSVSIADYGLRVAGKILPVIRNPQSPIIS